MTDDAVLEWFDAPVARADSSGRIVAMNEAFGEWAPGSADAVIERRGHGAWLHAPGQPALPIRVVPVRGGGSLVLPGADEGRVGLEAVVTAVLRRVEHVERSLEANTLSLLRERPTEAIAGPIRETLAYVQELRALSRLIAGLVPERRPSPNAICLRTLAREAVLSVSGPPPVSFGTMDPAAKVEADRERLFSVVAGLIGALTRRLPPGGRILVEVRAGPTTRLSAQSPDGLVSPLAGFELDAARTVLRAHGGRLLVDANRGAILELPGLEVPDSPGGTGGVVLVADDDEGVLAMMSAVLRRAGFVVLEADNGVAGVALLRSHATKLAGIVTDAVLPGLTGIELANEARRLIPTLPVLLVSGHPREAVGGPEDYPYLLKPFDGRDFSRRALDVIRGG